MTNISSRKINNLILMALRNTITGLNTLMKILPEIDNSDGNSMSD